MVNVKQALEYISINGSDLKNLAGYEEYRQDFLRHGLNPDHYHPLLPAAITGEEWVNLLRFYADKGGYEPAKQLLQELLGE
jgi:hypothetical protein